MSDYEELLNDLQDKYDDLVDKLEDTQIALHDREGAIFPEEMEEIECLRCHRMFTGHPEQRYCTRDCQYGWTPAPSYEQWYATMHPRSPWLRPSA